jgi:DnaJ-class molecular chaperone
LPLIEAIKGGSYQVKTIFGTKQISVPPLSRHKEEVIIPHHGVAGSGDQKIILEVQYPVDIAPIVQALEAN